MLAVLSYRGAGCELAASDVEQLRREGWTHAGLERLHELTRHGHDSQRWFHVAFEERASDCDAALRAMASMACDFTLFAQTGAADTDEQRRWRALEKARRGTVQDGSRGLRYQPHFRKVLHFHTAHGGPPAPGGMSDLKEGDPVFLGGNELVSPRFDVDPAVVEHCHQIAAAFSGVRGSLKWLETMKHSLRDNGLGWDQFGPLRKAYWNWSRARFCVRGTYEPRAQFQRRVRETLASGRQLLFDVLGTAPIAFAHPSREAATLADHCLGELGYSLSFSRHGLHDGKSSFAVPRLSIGPETPRPLRPETLALPQPRVPGLSIRRILYA